MRDYRYGSIWLVNFEPSTGTEIKKTRPALIISDSDFNQVRSKVTLLPITSQISKKLASVIVIVPASSDNGLNCDSGIVTMEPNTFDKRRLLKYIGELEAPYLAQMKRQLTLYLNL
jgi:mRNA interferase MazF